jgi:hypothetical protein
LPASGQVSHTGCAEGDIAGNWSLVATNIEEIGAASVLWCDVNLAKAVNSSRYDVRGQCRGHTPRETAPQSYELTGDQSLAEDSACKLSGTISLRQGQVVYTATIVEGHVAGSGAVKSRAVAVTRWPHANRYALQTLVMQR